ncbi:conserved domain protein [Yersinia pestis KIM D27]|nr:conserved domain protein [Yersinia pestis KIM D27]
MGAIRAKRPKKTEVSNNFGFAYPASSFSRLPDKTHKAGFPLVLAKSINALYF